MGEIGLQVFVEELLAVRLGLPNLDDARAAGCTRTSGVGYEAVR